MLHSGQQGLSTESDTNSAQQQDETLPPCDYGRQSSVHEQFGHMYEQTYQGYTAQQYMHDLPPLWSFGQPHTSIYAEQLGHEGQGHSSSLPTTQDIDPAGNEWLSAVFGNMSQPSTEFLATP